MKQRAKVLWSIGVLAILMLGMIILALWAYARLTASEQAALMMTTVMRAEIAAIRAPDYSPKHKSEAHSNASGPGSVPLISLGYGMPGSCEFWRFLVSDCLSIGIDIAIDERLKKASEISTALENPCHFLDQIATRRSAGTSPMLEQRANAKSGEDREAALVEIARSQTILDLQGFFGCSQAHRSRKTALLNYMSGIDRADRSDSRKPFAVLRQIKINIRGR